MTTIASAFGLSRDRFALPNERAALDRLEQGLERVEVRLSEVLRFTDPVADSVARYLKEAGGKRVRPMLLLLAAQLGEGATDEVIDAAAVVEITHLASLYHDDVMDEADVRRGVPSTHTVWGNSIAILAGDLLFSRAASLTAPLGEDVAELQARTFERLCLGQLYETLGPRDADPVEHYLRVLADKTGSLIAAAAELGIIVSGADPKYRAPMREFGEAIGVAFQLVDDVIDLSSDPSTGKSAGTDVRAGVPTMPTLLLDGLDDSASVNLRDKLSHGEADGFTDAVAELEQHRVTVETRQVALEWQARGLAALKGLPRGPVRRGLEEFARSVVDRQT
ncbi:MAG TPA: polyprenyl synthetase family protein [Candidatus Agrococcus pullicola]|uniref:Polyprenyl synthetase family protein n=1 Tax=Candidatus Agrococcus pullicola TaxID=2838429 RepID=A0A9D2C7V9_9MICO|nr:polyprenyl synthetase family protein [Candidatus Agrococcus pullicola]